MRLPMDVIKSLGAKSRKTREALLRLGEDSEDAAALIVVFKENSESIKAAMTHWLGDESEYQEAAKDVLLKIGEEARHFNPQTDDASDFVSEWAYLECRRLRLELESNSATSN